MADLAERRREARRRKLLMSSEDRLNKILQMKNKVKEEQDSVSENATNIEKEHAPESNLDCLRNSQISPIQEKEKTTIQQHDSILPDHHHQLPNKDPDVDSKDSQKEGNSVDEERMMQSSSASKGLDFGDGDKVVEGHSPEHLEGKQERGSKTKVDGTQPDDHQNTRADYLQTGVSQPEENSSDMICTTGPSEQSQIQTTPVESTNLIRQGPSQQDHNTPTLTPNVKSTKAQTKQKLHIGQIVSVREISCILLAVAMRWMLMRDWFTDYTGQSIFVPFFGLQLMIAALTSHKTKPLGGFLQSSISMGLMLCQVQPSTVARVTHLLAVSATICADLALYLFTFLMFHSVLEVAGY